MSSINGGEEFLQAAMIMAASTRALARIEGMKAENLQRAVKGESPSYVEEHFLGAIDEEDIGYNSIIEVLQGRRCI